MDGETGFSTTASLDTDKKWWPAFRERQLSMKASKSQKLFDLIFGCVLPIFWVCRLFSLSLNETYTNPHDDIEYFFYSTIVFSAVLLMCSILFDRFSHVLLGGFIGAFLYGAICIVSLVIPFIILTNIFDAESLGVFTTFSLIFIPFSVFSFYRNSSRVFKERRLMPKEDRPRWSPFLCFVIFIIMPFLAIFSKYSITENTIENILRLRNGELEQYLDTVHFRVPFVDRRQIIRKYIDIELDRVGVLSSVEKQEKMRNLDQAFVRLTGFRVESSIDYFSFNWEAYDN